jgi:hypothetical protein
VVDGLTRRAETRNIVTPLKKALRNIVQRMAHSYYEGPEPPKRITDIVEHFALSSPTATFTEWKDFAILHAREAYKTGYTRGFEYAERDFDLKKASTNPEILAAEQNHDWGTNDGLPPAIVNAEAEET